MSEKNPKMEGCNVIDCIPQTGECPLNCLECYYNGGRFYRTLNEPLIPTEEEARGKIVRVNSGHDSNLQFEKVISVTKKYEDKYYNTSIPILRFGAPTVLTLNGRDTDRSFYRKKDTVGNLEELMSVRFRVNTWNIGLCEEAIKEWNEICPVILTDMRYYHKELVKEPEYYQYGKHILNEYWKLNEKGIEKIMRLLKYKNVFWEGNPFSLVTLCKDCRLCEHFYMITKLRLKR